MLDEDTTVHFPYKTHSTNFSSISDDDRPASIFVLVKA